MIISIATTFVGTTDDMGNNIEGKYGLIDSKGNILAEPIYDKVSTNDGFIFAKLNDNYGVLKNGKEVVPFDYNGFYGYSNGNIIASRPLTEKEEKTYQKELEKIEEESNNQEEDEYYEEYYSEGDNSKIIGKFGLIDTTNKIIIPFKGKYGIINKSNKKILDFSFDKIFPIEEGNGEAYLKTKKGRKYGCIDSQAKIIAEAIYDQIDLSYSDAGFVIVTKNEKKGCINSEGELILPIEYDYIVIYDDNTFNVSIGDDNYNVDANNKRKDN